MAMIEQSESARGPVVEVAPGSSGGIAAVLRVAVPFSTIALHAGRYEVPVYQSACNADAATPRPASVLSASLAKNLRLALVIACRGISCRDRQSQCAHSPRCSADPTAAARTPGLYPGAGDSASGRRWGHDYRGIRQHKQRGQ